MKEFKPRITEIKHIGNELRFQRYYYNYKNNKNIVLKYDSKDDSNYKKLDEILLDFMNDKFGDTSESYASYDNLYAIENNKSRKKSDNYNPNTYYLRMYSLFKLYGFLDDYEIFNLLEKNNIRPNFKDTKLITRDLMRICEEEYQFNNRKKCFDLLSCSLYLSSSTISDILENKDFKFFSKVEYLEKCVKESKNSSIFFSKFKKLFKEKLSSLNKIERKVVSLEMGKPSDFVDNYLSSKFCTPLTCEAIIKFLKYFNLKKTDLYIALLHTTPAYYGMYVRDIIPHTHFRKLNKDFE